MGRARSPFVVGLTCLALLVVACDQDPTEIANPASQFCVSQGGRVDIVDEDDGQVGYCVLPDGTRVEEWEYYRANSTTVP